MTTASDHSLFEDIQALVSGTLLSVVFARRLQTGDPGGHMTEALAKFPIRAIADRVRNARTWRYVKTPSAQKKAHETLDVRIFKT